MDKDKRDSPPLTDSTESSNLCERVPDEIENLCGGDDESVPSSISTDDDDNNSDGDSVDDYPTTNDDDDNNVEKSAVDDDDDENNYIDNNGLDDYPTTNDYYVKKSADDDDDNNYGTNDDNSVDYPASDDAQKSDILFYDASRDSLNLSQSLEIKIADGTAAGLSNSSLGERAFNLLWNKSDYDMSKYEEISELDDDDDSLYKSWSESIEVTREWNSSYSLHRSIVRILIALLAVVFAGLLFSIIAIVVEKNSGNKNQSPTTTATTQPEYSNEISSSSSGSNTDVATTTTTKSNSQPPTLFVVTRDYTQTYNGTEIEYMDTTQMKSYERILELYTRYFEVFGEQQQLVDKSSSSGTVTTTCKIIKQKINIIPYESNNNNDDYNMDDDDDNDDDASVVKDRWRSDDETRLRLRRGLEPTTTNGGRNRDKDMKCLIVDFTMTFASDDIDVTEYPTQFLKFMNLYIGKKHVKDDMEDLGVRVEAVNDLSEKNGTTATTTP